MISINNMAFGSASTRHWSLYRCDCCRMKFERSKLTIFKLRYYCPYCLPGVKLAHDVIDKLRSKDV